MNFYAAGQATGLGKILLVFAKPIQLAASFTLTIYLFHAPLLVLFHDTLHSRGLICLTAVIASIVVLGYLTEHRRRELRALLMLVVRKYRAGASANARAETLPIILPADPTADSPRV